MVVPVERPWPSRRNKELHASNGADAGQWYRRQRASTALCTGPASLVKAVFCFSLGVLLVAGDYLLGCMLTTVDTYAPAPK
ncbi:hypothetical protein H113_02386 [Trichophyton rubrum MR1459]|uniref:Uncharacterized protein n=1 Tax=Trichophyton rubrum CBS 288.86 TaxID=1215330 RepID=A0A022WA34_TRIRU|nr:hypothetical protein H103_02381 [Trichophyton rubrum CBS 288.86]EZF97661.1 hypothetical protein H113_02386 [Trichophyton rubrum MR1459]